MKIGQENVYIYKKLGRKTCLREKLTKFWKTVPGFEEAMSRIKFLEPAISIEIQHDAYAFDYLSYPIISKVVYNNVFNIAVVYVWEGSARFSIRLVKNDGIWQIVEKKRELIL